MPCSREAIDRRPRILAVRCTSTAPGTWRPSSGVITGSPRRRWRGPDPSSPAPDLRIRRLAHAVLPALLEPLLSNARTPLLLVGLGARRPLDAEAHGGALREPRRAGDGHLQGKGRGAGHRRTLRRRLHQRRPSSSRSSPKRICSSASASIRWSCFHGPWTHRAADRQHHPVGGRRSARAVCRAAGHRRALGDGVDRQAVAAGSLGSRGRPPHARRAAPAALPRGGGSQRNDQPSQRMQRRCVPCGGRRDRRKCKMQIAKCKLQMADYPMKNPVVALALIAFCVAGCARAPEYDVVIRHGTVYDGTGAPAMRRGRGASRAIASSRAGDLSGARGRQEIDATGLAVAPGFIDMLNHSETSLIADGRSQGEIRQGVTLVGVRRELDGPAHRADEERAEASARATSSSTSRGRRSASISIPGDARRVDQRRVVRQRRDRARATRSAYDNRPPTADELERMRGARAHARWTRARWA